MEAFWGIIAVSSLTPMGNITTTILPFYIFYTLIVIHHTTLTYMEFIFHDSYATLSIPVCIKNFSQHYRIRPYQFKDYLKKLKNRIILSFNSLFLQDINEKYFVNSVQIPTDGIGMHILIRVTTVSLVCHKMSL